MRIPFRVLGLTTLCLFFSGCGIYYYPGQPGMVTNGYSKIDVEYLDGTGLWTYETTYDNRVGGKGVAAITSKYYANAKTYTANMRTNADGTYYRVKGQYDGAVTQMIILPQAGQILLPPKSRVELLIGFLKSQDEVDDRNIAEEAIFTNIPNGEWKGKRERVKELLAALRAGQLTSRGDFSYEVVSVTVGDKTVSTGPSILVETNFLQNAARFRIENVPVKELVGALESNFPKGYQGPVKFNLKNGSSVTLKQMRLHTLRTAEAAGLKIVRDASPEQIEQALASVAKN